MNKNLKQGLVLFLVSNIFAGIITQLSEMTMYLCVIANIPHSNHWYDYINEISLFMVIVSYIITLAFIIKALQEKRNKKDVV